MCTHSLHKQSRQCVLTIYTGIVSNVLQSHSQQITIRRPDDDRHCINHSKQSIVSTMCTHSLHKQVLTVCPPNLHWHCIKRFTQSIVSTMCTHSLHKQSWRCVLTIYTGIVSNVSHNPSSRQCALTVYTNSLDNVYRLFTHALRTCRLHNVSGSRSSRDLGPGDNWQDFPSVYVFSSWARRIRSHGHRSRSWNKTEEASRVHRAVGHHLNCPTPELTCIFNSCGKFTKFHNFSLLHI
jgi:hypothetical protein